MQDQRDGIWSRKFEWDGPAVRAWIWHHRVAILLGLGVLFRTGQYASTRSLWLDEASLVANARLPSPLAFFGPLISSQLAPPGFLVLEWSALRVAGDNPYGARLVPFLAGLGGLWLYLAVARRILPARAVTVAVALFVSADELIYFAAEAKQYSSDVAAALACTLVALTVGKGPLTARRSAILTAWGTLIVWFSHPSVFVLAAVGTLRLAGRIQARDARGAALWCVIGLAWVGSFALVHRVAMIQLNHDGMMWKFWAFAFPPAPWTLWDASWFLRRVAYLFVNPLHFSVPFGPRWSVVPALLAWTVGLVTLGRTRRENLALLVLPVGFVLAASTRQLYPFHGRLILFLVPAFLLIMAAGMDRLRDLRFGRGIVFASLFAVLVAVPMAVDVYRLLDPRDRYSLNPYGDRRPYSLDPMRYPR